jgi:hypothetical protein
MLLKTKGVYSERRPKATMFMKTKQVTAFRQIGREGTDQALELKADD